MTSAPWLTERDEAKYRRTVRRQYAECRARDPALMRRLRKLTDEQLEALYISLLERMPPNPAILDEIRRFTSLQAIRAYQAKARANPEPEPTQASQDELTDPALARATPSQSPQPAAPAEPIIAPTVATPAAPTLPTPRPNPKPANVEPLRCYPKAFGIGAETYWVGGEVPAWPSSRSSSRR